MDDNVFLFIPNIIGYARIALGLVSCWYMPTDHIRAALYYIVSGGLDAFDGYAARAFGQSSRFGAMLDQLTDRCATMALLMTLCHLYPRWMFLFQLSAIIDIASHWLHLHSNDLRGGATHKASSNPILHLYYTSRPFLFAMCAGNELFYATLYLTYFTHGPRLLFGVGLIQVICGLTLPIALVKSIISLVHLVQAANDVVAVDVANRRREAEKDS